MKRTSTLLLLLTVVLTVGVQEEPYNDECPIYNGKVTGYTGQRYVTGCVATAMARDSTTTRTPS